MKNYNAYLKKSLKEDPAMKKDMDFESWLLELSINISELRKERGYSQEDFAEKLGISQSSVARIESGQNMRCSTIWKISDALEVELEIFGADKTMEEQKIYYFCSKENNIKEVVGTTTEKKIMEYDTKNTSFTTNLFNYATC